MVQPESAISRVVIVGGGTAGWLSACLIAAAKGESLQITLIESPDVATVGVGEGTWPTMRNTLQRIGISESEFLSACDASFKQGSRFDGWRTGAPDDSYFHPFTPPVEVDTRQLLSAWNSGEFSGAVAPQTRVAGQNLAPRLPNMPDYAGALNYAYHLDATKFAALLKAHATERLGVEHVRDHVVSVERSESGDIAAVLLRETGRRDGDFFIDCTGHAALLIGETLGIQWVDRGNILFNNRALAVQVPVADDSAIQSQTNATAHESGWIWDIGLQNRRGIGCVYASDFMDDSQAEQVLKRYIGATSPDTDFASLNPRKLQFKTGHREQFWSKNCLSIGLSAGFIEPLEASAIVLIELSVDHLIDNFPTDRHVMDIQAKRFNARFRLRWDRIVEFLKLHYVVSTRTEAYWQHHRDPATLPDRLGELLELWRYQPPGPGDLDRADEIFPAASYQYVLYGMGYQKPQASPVGWPVDSRVADQLAKAEQRARSLAASLPTNRAYLDALKRERLSRTKEFVS